MIRSPAREPTLIITPERLSTMFRAADRVTRKGPLRLTSIRRLKSSSSIRGKGSTWATAALLTRTSIFPHRSTVSSTIRSSPSCSSTETLQATHCLAPNRSIISRAFSSLRTKVNTTRAPSSINRATISQPMSPVPPVTITTASSSFKSIP